MAEANKRLQRSGLSPLEILEKANEGTCSDDCKGGWFSCDQEIFHWNGISQKSFAEAVTNLLGKARGNFRNILLVGLDNSAKTFLLQPLTVIFETFWNPATSTFEWVGAEHAEVIF